MTDIENRPLGHSGIHVSVLGLGCNQFGTRLDLEATGAVIDAALSEGITFLDTADRYGGTKSEEYIGQILGGRRDQVVLGTKFGSDLGDGVPGPRGGREYIRHALHNSLTRLRTDFIDLYWYHRPDGVTPMAETLRALDELVKEGKVRAIGASNLSADQIREADEAARQDGLTRFSAIQNEYSLLNTAAEADVLPLCEELELAFIPYYPLASGLLTGKYQRGQAGPEGARLTQRDQIATDEQWELVEALSGFAQAREVPLINVAIGYLLTQRAVASVTTGATRPEQLAANTSAAAWTPDQDDLAELRALLARAR